MELRMSRKERDRLKVMAALAQRRMRQKEASRLLRLSERQARLFAVACIRFVRIRRPFSRFQEHNLVQTQTVPPSRRIDV